MYTEPEFHASISLGQVIQIGQITVIAAAFLFRKYFGTETSIKQTEAHTGLIAANSEAITRLTNIVNLQQALLEKIEHRLGCVEKDFYVPVVQRERRERREDRDSPDTKTMR